MAFGNCLGITEITIPKGVTAAQIDAYAHGRGPFGNCTNLSAVTFENGITKIPANLFSCCTGKIETVLPDTVTEIGYNAFENSGLLTIKLSEKLKKIQSYAFAGCRNLSSIIIPGTVTSIESSVFSGCSAMTTIRIPESVTEMGEAVFKNCSSLYDVNLSSSCVNIKKFMFEGCASLEKITLPDKVTTIEASTFLDCSALKEIVWSKALTAIKGSAFKNCSSLVEITVPETVTSLGSEAFSNCDALTTITIPDSVTSFGTSMFYDCDALTTVKLGSGLTAIPKSTFEHCDVLETLTVPRRVTSIGANAFKDSVKFSSIFIPQSVTSIDATAFSYPAKLTIYGVPGTYAETFANDNSITFVAQQTSATAIALDPTTLSIAKGSTAQLKLTVTPEGFTDAVIWKSADTSVATVTDTGLVKAVNNGSTVIKVTAGKVSASCKVTVVQPVTSISLNRSAQTLEALQTFQLVASVYPANAADPRVAWSSSAPEIATVSDTGLVTALKKGTAVITASSMDGGNVSRSCTVTVSNTAYLCQTVAELESPHNYENSCTDVWSYTIPGASELKVSFDARTCMEDGFDYLYIYGADGKEVGKYTGTELSRKTITVPGNTVRIKMKSDDSGNDWGFKVTSVSADAVSPVTVRPIGAGQAVPEYQLDGDTLTVTYDLPCRVGYLGSDGTYLALQPSGKSAKYDISGLPAGTELVLVVLGDFNGDGALTTDDISALRDAILEKSPSTELQAFAADGNKDGKLSAADVSHLRAAVLGKTVSPSSASSVTYSAALNTPTLPVSAQAQTVTLTVTASKKMTAGAIGMQVAQDAPLALQEISNGALGFADIHVNYNNGMLVWDSENAENVTSDQLARVTFIVPANTPAGTYRLGVTDIEISKDCGEIWEPDAEVYATLTIIDADSPKAPQTITAEDVTVHYGDSARIRATTSGNSALSYEVTSGHDVIDVDSDGTLTIKQTGSAVVTITAAETDEFFSAVKDVQVTVLPAEDDPAQRFNDLMAKIPENTADIGRDSLADIEAAEEAYNEAILDKNVKKNLDKTLVKRLKAARKAYSKNEKAAQKVQALIDKLPEASALDYSKDRKNVEKAEKAFDKLTGQQPSFLEDGAADKLFECATQMEKLGTCADVIKQAQAAIKKLPIWSKLKGTDAAKVEAAEKAMEALEKAAEETGITLGVGEANGEKYRASIAYYYDFKGTADGYREAYLDPLAGCEADKEHQQAIEDAREAYNALGSEFTEANVVKNVQSFITKQELSILTNLEKQLKKNEKAAQKVTKLIEKLPDPGASFTSKDVRNIEAAWKAYNKLKSDAERSFVEGVDILNACYENAHPGQR